MSQQYDTKTGYAWRNIVVSILILVILGLVYILLTHTENTNPVDTVAIMSPQNPSITNTDKYADTDTFYDGLENPGSATFSAPDEFGVGVTSVKIYFHDLNDDGRPDRITRTHYENGTSHFTNDYQIELATDEGYINITPDDLQTRDGADCALQKLRFSFAPMFQIEQIGREMGENYLEPTMAYRTVYRLQNDKLVPIIYEPVMEVCDVADLFKNDSARAE